MSSFSNALTLAITHILGSFAEIVVGVVTHCYPAEEEGEDPGEKRPFRQRERHQGEYEEKRELSGPGGSSVWG